MIWKTVGLHGPKAVWLNNRSSAPHYRMTFKETGRAKQRQAERRFICDQTSSQRRWRSHALGATCLGLFV